MSLDTGMQSDGSAEERMAMPEAAVAMNEDAIEPRLVGRMRVSRGRRAS